jgi:hypothetical protein
MQIGLIISACMSMVLNTLVADTNTLAVMHIIGIVKAKNHILELLVLKF